MDAATFDLNTATPSARPVAFMDPWAPLESGGGEPATAEHDDSVVTSAPLESAEDSGEGVGSSHVSAERVEGFRARLAAARALAEANAAAAAASEDDTGDPIALDEGVAVAAVSQTMPIASEPPPPPAAPVVAPAPPKPLERPRRRVGEAIALAAIVLANAGLGFGLANLHREEEQGRAPVAAMSAEVKVLQSVQTAATAELEHTRSRLDEHEAKLANTIEKVNAVAQRQADAERAAREHADHQAKEVAAVNARVNRMERRFDAEVYSVDDLVKAIDVVQKGSASSASGARAQSSGAR